MKKLLASIGMGMASFALISAPALAATISNGSFETGTPPGSFLTLYSPNTTDLPGWSVTSGNIDVIGSYWTSYDGSRSIDLNGYDPGTISQTFSTVAGHVYTVTFYLAGNPDGGPYGSPAVKTLTVDTGGAPTAYSFDTTGHSDSSMGWTKETYSFTAAASSTVLTFASTTTAGPATQYGHAFGPALDNVSIAVNPPTNKDQCKHDAWKDYTDPSFKNQGQCIAWVNAEVEGRLKMANPTQKIVFDDVSNQQKGHIEYWNYEYNGGTLQYNAKVMCAYVNPQTQEARVMWQIPAGHPGLSDLYVVAYVKKVPNAPDLYGHAATSDLNTAMQWCQTGEGFSPTFYPVTDGHVHFE